jgi:hypothetical protein
MSEYERFLNVLEAIVTLNHPTVVVETCVVEANSEEEAIEIAKSGETAGGFINWERQEEDAFGLCHYCADKDEYEAELNE